MSSLPPPPRIIGHSGILKDQWPGWDKEIINESGDKCVSQQGIAGQSDPYLLSDGASFKIKKRKLTSISFSKLC